MLKDNKTIPINKRYSRFYPALDLLGMKHSYPIVNWPLIFLPLLLPSFHESSSSTLLYTLKTDLCWNSEEDYYASLCTDFFKK